MEIVDGAGTGNRAKVDRDNRLYTNSVTREEVELSILLGDGYNINTGEVEVTNAGVDNALVYLKNNSISDLIVYEILIILGTSTGGTGDGTLKVFRNPDAGTIISGANAVENNVNRNFGSSNTLDIDAYKGITGSTVSGGTILGTTGRGVSGVIPFTSTSFILPKGSSIGISWAAASGNTSQKVRVATTAFVRTNEI